MNYFLDTNICIYFLKGKGENIEKNIRKLNPNRIKIPSVVKAELLLGAFKSNNQKKNREIVLSFLDPFEIIGFNDIESEIYAEVRSGLEIQGIPIGPNDLLVASVVLSSNGILVTNNEKEFKRIPNLKIENWL
ncbi:type II toxin-antitoxin system tRNA(fMet)-specific endonuclease VapC [Leptospira borgpetersenii]|uniref:type II toxin-antitoxin system tRNA(fMet)-specific endonuclease VapC n=1 Tax=Leptospira borgpetersenii TaxID=174 RepID=UPI0003452E29|nr:type II toxin-antitoxin system VapC family toxin [Leptospira borgpetersenii]AXX15089.1 VapC toxin family PIN domain ribonuclease [Leptospira borgpetersenii serovar Ceylonica]QVK60068.1 type II toxin-antitoxin system VapC family toxin [Leptospira borgpetersenii]URD69441.1 type II toxin-antitoxin system VapC family toxin [Leptospira borgpetersenii]UVD72617.1 type II toxin-antitoxin system VapC family toxin [Leptospira borgpetersenii]UVD75810.1 type II toxin-antitoxin system VapC family toxin 